MSEWVADYLFDGTVIFALITDLQMGDY